MRRWLLAGLLGVCASGAVAADSGGFYVGAGYGEAYVEDRLQNPNGGEVHFDAHDRSYRAFIGYRGRATAHVDLAGEATYINYGRASQTSQGVTFQHRFRGGELAALAILPAGLIDVYGKGGIVRWSSTLDVGDTSTSRNGVNGLYGFGAAFNVGKLGVRAEYDFYDVSVVDKLKTFTLSAVFYFY